MAEVNAVKPPKKKLFWVRFKGSRGGIHEVKIFMELLAGAEGGIVGRDQARKVQQRAYDRGYITRVASWEKPARAVGQKGWIPKRFVGYLIYGIKAQDAWKHAKHDWKVIDPEEFEFGPSRGVGG